MVGGGQVGAAGTWAAEAYRAVPLSVHRRVGTTLWNKPNLRSLRWRNLDFNNVHNKKSCGKCEMSE